MQFLIKQINIRNLLNSYKYAFKFQRHGVSNWICIILILFSKSLSTLNSRDTFNSYKSYSSVSINSLTG